MTTRDHIWLAAMFSTIVLLVSASSRASDGAQLAKKCDQCHGENGHSEKQDVPSIGGFSEFGIEDLLVSYRQGTREPRTYKLPDGSETDMKKISEALSEDDVTALGQHYASQPWLAKNQPFDEKLARRGAQIHDIKCDKCHSLHGGEAEDDLAIMLGQWREYLRMEFEDFDAGKRKMAKKMKEKYDTLNSEDKQAILELYVSGGRL